MSNDLKTNGVRAKTAICLARSIPISGNTPKCESGTSVGHDAYAAGSKVTIAGGTGEPFHPLHTRWIFVAPAKPHSSSTSQHDAATITQHLKALRKGNINERGEAARELGKIGPAAKAAIPALTLALEDKNPYVRAHAAIALSAIDPTSQEATGALIAQLIVNPRNSIRVQAAEALGNMKTRNALLALSAALKDQEKDVRFTAALAIGNIGNAPKAAIPALLAIGHSLGDITVKWCYDSSLGEVKCPIDEVARSVAKVLVEIGPAAVPALVKDWKTAHKRDSVTGWRQHRLALDVLLKMGPVAKDAVPDIVAELANNEEAVWLLGRIGRPALPALITTLKNHDEDWKRRELAAEALGLIGAPAVPPLIAALKEGDEKVRVLVADALSRVGAEAIPALKVLLQSRIAHERIAASEILGKIRAAEEAKKDYGRMETPIPPKVRKPFCCP